MNTTATKDQLISWFIPLGEIMFMRLPQKAGFSI